MRKGVVPFVTMTLRANSGKRTRLACTARRLAERMRVPWRFRGPLMRASGCLQRRAANSTRGRVRSPDSTAQVFLNSGTDHAPRDIFFHHEKKKLASGNPPRIHCRSMKLTTVCGMIAAGVFACSGLVQAGSTKEYQVTGPVLEMNDTMIAVQKGKDRWEIARDSSTKVNGDVKVGSKVTIMYTMTATSVEAKAEKGAAKK